MLEYLSEQPPPNNAEIVDYLVRKLYPKFENHGACQDEIRVIAEEALVEFGHVGSLAAWYAITSHALTQNVRVILKKKFDPN